MKVIKTQKTSGKDVIFYQKSNTGLQTIGIFILDKTFSY